VIVLLMAVVLTIAYRRRHRRDAEVGNAVDEIETTAAHGSESPSRRESDSVNVVERQRLSVSGGTRGKIAANL
jgi:hypothetical protein